jgi:hypothetical protein
MAAIYGRQHMTPWENPDSYEPEERPALDGVRELSGWVIALAIVTALLIYGVIAVVRFS